MKSAYSIPVTAFKIGDLSGSDLAVVAVIHVAWPNRVRRRRPAPTPGPRDVLRGARDGRLRMRRSPRSIDRVSTSKIRHWGWKATFPAIWPSVIRNSTPLPVCSVMHWMSFFLALDGLDRGRMDASAAPELYIFRPAPSIRG